AKTNYLNGITSDYAYDQLYELTQVTQGASTTESYSYDAVGNRLSSSGVPSYNYNVSNELTSSSSGGYSYDANGNTLSDAQGRSFTWDFENRLIQAVVPGTNGGTTTFKYDPFGRRIQKSGPLGTTNYLYGETDAGRSAANVIEEVDNSGNVLARYVPNQSLGIDQPLAELRSGTTSYYEQDGLGSVTTLSTAAGTLANTYTYDSFGNLTASTGSVTNPFQYTGRDYDPETGLRYYRTRYFDPTVGRFISEDMAHFEGGSNFYRYVRNSPTRFVDPFGLAEVNPQDMASMESLFPGYTSLSKTGIVVPVPCDVARRILEQNGFYSSDNWPSIPTPVPNSGGLSIPGNPFLFWDPIAHSGGWEFRKPDGMHIRMKYPNKPCDKDCTLDEAHEDEYNPMYDPWGHFWYELVPYVVSKSFPIGPPVFF
ncbi:MAG: RHS repeat-associated core domain-containing protein, partial [Candidatus Sulfotelmatobacter sp.]